MIMLTAEQTQTKTLKGKLFRGLADTSRLAILEALRLEKLNVSQIVARTGLTQSNASNHLGCLRECGLVVAEPDGRQVFYSLSDPRVGALLDLADELLAEVARGVAVCEEYNE
jgi:DNA-binding transcriptional ArsR family regulator